MGVYIKGMKMPKICFECDLYNDESNFCKAQKEYLPFALFGQDCKDANCPLVEVPEPHGDLIDRDAVLKEMINGIKAGNYEEGYEHYPNINNMDDCVECVRYADAVIEAEDE